MGCDINTVSVEISGNCFIVFDTSSHFGHLKKIENVLITVYSLHIFKIFNILTFFMSTPYVLPLNHWNLIKNISVSQVNYQNNDNFHEEIINFNQ